ncbi:aspartic proteinase-like protein 2 [Phalaenopsis equestris]|uniref:aspartic proteinase-like protein 2 n=1 Tax=Phalaenopsis equestris TaxID=78828 RepID=UPI0009E1E4D2|nr:aspartic proteinase-like protein 2 [Phalaenopsis equestris]
MEFRLFFRSHIPLILLLYFTSLFEFGGTTGVLKVQRKFSGQRQRITDLRAHDVRRHGRILIESTRASVDLPLGGLGRPTATGLYYAQIGIGTPSKAYYAQVDTGSDILWVNCITCRHCPKKSDLGIELTLYDPKGSSTGKLVSCHGSFCSTTYRGNMPGCSSDMPCEYKVQYVDGSSTSGFFVTDYLQYNQVSGNHQTGTANSTVTFGCGAQQSGDLGSSSEALDGILGFGQSNSSMLSQLALAGKVRKIFAHCLDTINGGGIFAIGNVVQPKVNTTPMVPDTSHYNVIMKSIAVGGTSLKLPTDVFQSGDMRGTIIDSGTTLAYLPEEAFKPLMNAIFSYQPDLSFQNIREFLCFQFSGSIDAAFPKVTFFFENSVELQVYPHDYFFENEGGIWCTGFQNSALQSKDGKDIFLLGDLVLSNKLVVYDLENQVIGWTDYNCSSSIKIQDDKTGAIYSVDAHNLSSSARSLNIGKFISLLIICFMFHLFH